MSKIVAVSDRGQITIPKKIRAQVPALSFSCSVQDGKIILSPVHMIDDHGTIITSSHPNHAPKKPKPDWSDL
jgi:hypothetical protein